MFKRQKVYYFSEKTLSYEEKKRFSKSSLKKVSFGALIFIFLIVIIDFFSNNYVSEIFLNIIQSERRNVALVKQIKNFKNRVDSIQNQIDKLFNKDHNLRLLVNLQTFDKETAELGTGGKRSDFKYGENNFESLNELETELNKYSRQISFQERSFSEVFDKFKSDQKLFECIPALIPMHGTFDAHSFGMRKHPILGYVKMHEGVDIISDNYTSIYAPGNGLVEKIGYESGYGLSLEINHSYGYKTFYAHLANTSVKVGEEVKRGELIAYSGNSGLSTGPHLHYEISLNGIKLNPVSFFLDFSDN